MTVRDQERFDFIYRKYYKKLLRTAVNMLQNVPAGQCAREDRDWLL